MNKKVPYLTRQIVYAFLVGLIVGGGLMAFANSGLKKPLFSGAAPCDPDQASANPCPPQYYDSGPSTDKFWETTDVSSRVIDDDDEGSQPPGSN